MAPADVSAEPSILRIDVVYSAGPGRVDCVPLRLESPATVGSAVQASGLLSRHPELQRATLRLGIWGALCEGDTPLRDRDRVEIYRPLKVDPKEARRLRQRKAAGPPSSAPRKRPAP